jgi:hypothetical protein
MYTIRFIFKEIKAGIKCQQLGIEMGGWRREEAISKVESNDPLDGDVVGGRRRQLLVRGSS